MSLVPLAALPAVARPAAVSSITGTPGGTTGGYTITYTITNNGNGSGLTKIEFPEIHLGDIVFATDGSGGVGGQFNWTATEVSSPTLAGSGLYTGTAAGYVDLTTNNGYGIGGNSSLSFVANVPAAATINAAFAIQYQGGTVAIIDPPIPNTTSVAAVPEPASLLALGSALVGLAAVRRRKA